MPATLGPPEEATAALGPPEASATLGQPEQAAKLGPPVETKVATRPLEGRFFDLVSSVIGNESGYGLAGITKTLSLGLGGNLAAAAGVNPDQPAIVVPKPSPEFAAAHPIAAGTIDAASGLIEGLTTPKAVATLAQGPVGASQFIADMAVNAPEQAARFGSDLGDGNIRAATSDILGYAMGTIIPGVVAREGFRVAPQPIPDAAPTTTIDASGLPDLSKEPTQPQPTPPAPPAPTALAPLPSVPETAPVETTPNPDSQLGPSDDVYGIAERVRDARAASGQGPVVAPGEGIAPQDSVDRGRQLISDGVDPEKALSDFEQTKKLSSDDMAVVRAAGEQLAQAAKDYETSAGVDSQEYKSAFDALSKWDERSKAMQTEWAKTGQAQQGATDIDTGTFTGLQRAYFADSGKDFTPDQADEAKGIASKSSQASTDAEAAKAKLFDALRESQPEPPKSVAQKISDILDKTAGDALARIRERRASGQINALAPEDLLDHAIFGASKIAKGVTDFAQWSSDMVKDLGDYVKPHLDEIWKAANDHLASVRQQVAGSVSTPVEMVWAKAKSYINGGMDDFDDIRNKIATDLGMPVNDVTKYLAQNQKIKTLSNDLWKKQQQARNLKTQAQRWVTQTSIPSYQKAIQSIPKVLFGLKVGFHGTVALGTHAPMVAFQPQFWKDYANNFGRMYKMVGSPAYYEMQVQDLQRRPNYITARRAGLVNDPASYEDYNSPDMAQYIRRLSGMGNRGYAVLKILRQDMFDHHWNNLPESVQTPEMAQGISDAVNHATGVVKGKAPPGSNLALFAPRLLASRVAWLARDPIRAADTFARWNTASDAEKQFAINQVKEKAWVVGTLYGLLALNQGVLSATGSRQKINGIPESLGGAGFDPMKGDFMKFKAAGMQLSYGNAMLSLARLPVRLYQIRQSDGGKLKHLVYPDEDTYTVLGEYGRSQMSPFASLATDLWMKSDWMHRNLPDSNRPMPTRLLRQGIKPYTWPEFWTEELLPIPGEEAAKEVWKNGLGMSAEQMDQALKAAASIAVMAATGARLTDDWPAKY